MRLGTVGLIILLSAGCRSAQMGRLLDRGHAAPDAAVCASGYASPAQPGAPGTATCPPGATGQPQIVQHHHHYQNCPADCPPKKSEGPPPAPQRQTQPTPEEQKSAIVTQDIMLIPRMVYVPYAPQVPVAPARLGMAVPGGHVVPQTDTTPAPAPVQQPQRQEKDVCDALEKVCKKLDEMGQRITVIEAKTQCLPAPAPACPPARPGLFHRSNP